MPSNDYLQNGLQLNRFDTKIVLRQLREKVDPDAWTEHTSVALVNAFYNGDINSMEFPAGILQGVFFNSQAPRYMNFGAIGMVIGHEITHGFDDRGRQYDGTGSQSPWWSEETIQNFAGEAQCFIDQYEGYNVPELEDMLGE